MLYIGITFLVVLLGVGIKIRSTDRKKLEDKVIKESVNEVFQDNLEKYFKEYNSKIEEIITAKINPLIEARSYGDLQKQIDSRLNLIEEHLKSQHFEKINSSDKNIFGENDLLLQRIIAKRSSIPKVPYVNDRTFHNDSVLYSDFENIRMGDVNLDDRNTRIFNGIFKKNTRSSTNQTVS